MIPNCCLKLIDIRYRFYIILILSCVFIYNLTMSNYYIQNRARAFIFTSFKTDSLSFVFPSVKFDGRHSVTQSVDFSTLNESSYENITEASNNAPYCPLIPQRLRKFLFSNFLQN